MAHNRMIIRERILKTAKQSFERLGYKRTALDDLVKQVGIAKGTFYLHFSSKEELLLEILSTLRQQMMEELQKEMEKEPSVLARIRLFLEISFTQMDKEPLLSKLQSEDPEFAFVLPLLREHKQQAQMDQGLDLIRRLLQEGIESGELRPDLDLKKLPVVLTSLRFLHFHQALLTSGRMSPSSYYAGVIELVLQGLQRSDAKPTVPTAKRKESSHGKRTKSRH